MKTNDLLKINNGVEYVLVHGPELRSHQQMDMCLRNGNPDKITFVEGHLKPAATATAREIATQLRTQGVNAGLMVDYCHISLSEARHLSNFDDAWKLSIQIARRNIQKALNFDPQFPVGQHVPIGDGEGLPWELMDDEKLKDIAHLREEFPQLITVIEHSKNFGVQFT